jgi:beta-galactosidase
LAPSWTPQAFRWVLEQALQAAHVEIPLARPAGVEIVERSSGDDRWLFVLNHGSEPVEVGIDRTGVDIITGTVADGSIRVGAVDVAVVYTSAPPAD